MEHKEIIGEFSLCLFNFTISHRLASPADGKKWGAAADSDNDRQAEMFNFQRFLRPRNFISRFAPLFFPARFLMSKESVFWEREREREERKNVGSS